MNVECKNTEETEKPEEEDDIECPPGAGIAFVASKIRCDWYYICMQGVPSKMQCAEGLHFSEKESRCESIETANCQIGMPSSTVPPPTTSTLAPTSPPTTSPPSTSPPSTNEFDKYCKPNELHSIPHPYKCNNFLLCFNGTAVERWCAEDLHFSAKHETCLPPREAHCIADGTICPEVNDVNDIIVLENVYDCNSFYMCFNGSPIPIQCAPGQHWNQEKETCVLQQNSNCQVIIVFTSFSLTTTFFFKAIEYLFPDLNINHATCHATGTYLVPQHTDGTAFVLCDNGVASILNFSAQLN